MKKIIIVLAVILLGGYFAYPGIQGKMNEARLKRENPNAEIIGKADGPTAIFTTNNKNTDKDRDGEKNNNQEADYAGAIGIIGGSDDSLSLIHISEPTRPY